MTSMGSSVRRVSLLSWIRFCPKRTFSPDLRNRASVRRGSLLVAAVLWFTVVMAHRSQGLTTRKVIYPIRTSLQVSSAKGSQPRTTRLRRKRSMGTGSSNRAFRSAREASEMSMKGKPSARPTWSLDPP